MMDFTFAAECSASACAALEFGGMGEWNRVSTAGAWHASWNKNPHKHCRVCIYGLEESIVMVNCVKSSHYSSDCFFGNSVIETSIPRLFTLCKCSIFRNVDCCEMCWYAFNRIQKNFR